MKNKIKPGYIQVTSFKKYTKKKLIYQLIKKDPNPNRKW